jgi:sugar phosphate isomerase/epimerase
VRATKWGIPTLIEAPDPEESAKLCRKLGFSFVELNMNLPEYQHIHVPLLRSVMDSYGVYFTIHLDENMDMCGFNSRVADAYMQTLLDAIRSARELNVPVLNMHLSKGVYFTLPNKKTYLYDMNREHFLGRVRETIAMCEEAAGGEVTICIENTGIYALSFIQEAVELFLQSPLFGLTFDIGHDHSAEGVDKPLLLKHKDRLRHFHIHDALGRKNHMVLGTGELDLPWYIALAEQNSCRAVLEVKTAQALRESAEWLRERQFI